MRASRREAAERFLATALPTDALEEWRYSRIDALDLERFQPAGPPAEAMGPDRPDRAAANDLVQALVGLVGRPATIVETVDGYVAQAHGSDRAVTVERLSAPDARPVDLGAIAGEPDAFAVLNRAFAPGPVRIRVGRGPETSRIAVVHWVDGDDVAVFPRLLVELEEQAEALVLEVIAGPGAGLAVPVTELDVPGAARLAYLHVQDLGPDAWQIALQASRVSRDATVVSAAVALGGDYARLRTASSLVGPGASSRLLALYFGVRNQMHDFRTVQRHQAQKTQSDLLYKGAVANSARSVYSGLIRVEKGARGTNALQTNRNLVLHEGAHADSVPNLEIEDNDVRCSHASAVGPIAEDQRFYLESRGVPPAVADRLITLGFLGEVLEQLPLEGSAPPLRTALAARLAEAEAVEAAAHGAEESSGLTELSGLTDSSGLAESSESSESSGGTR
jgi:Fe-S cluster assembly protein SufD